VTRDVQSRFEISVDDTSVKTVVVTSPKDTVTDSDVTDANNIASDQSPKGICEKQARRDVPEETKTTRIGISEKCWMVFGCLSLPR
jgi:hypothetical protein